MTVIGGADEGMGQELELLEGYCPVHGFKEVVDTDDTNTEKHHSRRFASADYKDITILMSN